VSEQFIRDASCHSGDSYCFGSALSILAEALRRSNWAISRKVEEPWFELAMAFWSHHPFQAESDDMEFCQGKTVLKHGD
jgi:hypothetical protein